MPLFGARGSGAVRAFGLFGADRPSAPTIGTATKNTSAVGRVSVAFTPNSDNGAPITSYTVTSSPGGITASGSSSPIVVTGLTNGSTYTFTVTATNVVGTSDASGSSNSAQASQWVCNTAGCTANQTNGTCSCTTTNTYSATYVPAQYSCPSGYSYTANLSCDYGACGGLSCWRCRCTRYGGCGCQSTTPTLVSNAYYYCPSGGNLSGSTCYVTNTSTNSATIG